MSASFPAPSDSPVAARLLEALDGSADGPAVDVEERGDLTMRLPLCCQEDECWAQLIDLDLGHGCWCVWDYAEGVGGCVECGLERGVLKTAGDFSKPRAYGIQWCRQFWNIPSADWPFCCIDDNAGG